MDETLPVKNLKPCGSHRGEKVHSLLTWYKWVGIRKQIQIFGYQQVGTVIWLIDIFKRSTMRDGVPWQFPFKCRVCFLRAKKHRRTPMTRIMVFILIESKLNCVFSCWVKRKWFSRCFFFQTFKATLKKPVGFTTKNWRPLIFTQSVTGKRASNSSTWKRDGDLIPKPQTLPLLWESKGCTFPMLPPSEMRTC